MPMVKNENREVHAIEIHIMIGNSSVHISTTEDKKIVPSLLKKEKKTQHPS